MVIFIVFENIFLMLCVHYAKSLRICPKGQILYLSLILCHFCYHSNGKSQMNNMHQHMC